MTPEQVLLEVPAAYEGGHPNVLQKATGRLLMAESGFFFVNESGGPDVEALYAQVRDVTEPRVGQFPRELVERAGAYKTAAKVGAGLARFGGTVVGGIGGRAIKAVGGAASEVVQGTTALGTPPRNRLTILVVAGGTPHKVLFDVGGESKADIEQRVEAFWFRIAAVRSQFGSGGASAGRPAPARRPTADVAPGGSFRLLTPTGVAHLSAHDLIALIGAGGMSDSDMVCLPVGTLRLLLGVGNVIGLKATSTGAPEAGGSNGVSLRLNPHGRAANRDGALTAAGEEHAADPVDGEPSDVPDDVQEPDDGDEVVDASDDDHEQADSTESDDE